MTINNNNIFGAFTLNEARGSRLTGDWLNKEFVANYGWFGGGVNPSVSPGFYSTVDRIDFSNDSVTAQVRGSLSAVKYGAAATGNSNYGWFGGGTVPGSPSSISTVDRIDFSNDSSTASPRGPLNAARYFHTATGNSNYGWFGGGGASGGKTFIERIDFSNDSGTASLRGSIITPRSQSAATGNSNYGWFGGGSGSIPGAAPFAVMTLVDRIDFSNDATTASPRGPLSLARSNLTATGNSNYGWFGGGFPDTSTVDRIDFANDSTSASVRGTLIDVRYNQAATGNSNYGWFGGGTAPGGTIGQVNRIDFSNDLATASVRGGALSLARRRLAATSGVLNIRRQKAGNFGWFGGGNTGSPVATTALVDRIDFSNDTGTASVRGSLSLARRNLAATGNSNYGWFGGGNPDTATVDRIDFSNDSSTASVRGPLSSTRYLGAATGNSNYGWFGGSQGFPNPLSSIDRINFSNDLASVSPRGRLSSTRNRHAATGNSNYGWFGGGAGVTTIDRIDFSNDSSTASVRGPLSSTRYFLAATGNSNYGWFGGGSTPTTPTIKSTTERIDFSNDATTASPRGPLSLARSNLTATGNSNYGWFGGGKDGIPAAAQQNAVDRINFSNDLATASVRGSLSATRYGLAAVSNTPT
jgi:hypothetical protein